MSKDADTDSGCYRPLTPIDHDDVRYEIGDELWLSDEEAAPLLALNAIEGSVAAPTTAGVDAADIEALAEACARLDADNAELFTTSGKPQVSALEDIVGVAVTAADRDAAWAIFSAAQSADNAE